LGAIQENSASFRDAKGILPGQLESQQFLWLPGTAFLVPVADECQPFFNGLSKKSDVSYPIKSKWCATR
jgi:hypothetical protein